MIYISYGPLKHHKWFYMCKLEKIMFSHIITNFLGLSMLKIQLKAKGIVIMCMF